MTKDASLPGNNADDEASVLLKTKAAGEPGTH